MSKIESNFWRANPFQELEKQHTIEPAQQLRLLDDHLTNTISIVQQLLSTILHMGGELRFAADMAYQKKVTELYNMVKGWVGE